MPGIINNSDGPEMREFGDVPVMRRWIYDKVLDSVSNLAPVSNHKYTLNLRDASYVDPERFTKRQSKDAILGRKSLGRRIRGTWELVDNETGKVVDRRKQIIAHVPFLTDHGTFIKRGVEYGVVNQPRLRPGVYTRVKGTGELETHVNVMKGSGISHRYFLDPKSGVFRIRIGQGTLPLMPFIRAMGISDDQMREAWGKELFAANYQAADPAAVKKLAQRILRKSDLTDPSIPLDVKIRRRFEAMPIDPSVTSRTLGRPYDRITGDMVLDATRKLLAVSRGEQDPDDRDHLAYQTVYSPEDLFAERVAKDHGGLRRQLLYKLTKAGNLKAMPSGVLTKQLDQVIYGSGLSSPLEEVNPVEIFDKLYRSTRMGEGGIGSVESIPDESRAVQPSQLGFVDPIRTSESMAVGVDVYFASGARKGKDGKIYTRVRDLKTGDTVWKAPDDLADSAVAFPGSLKLPYKRVPALKGGRMTFVRKDEIDYEVPDFERAFSPTTNLIPLISTDKGQRGSMASRMLTQALPLKNAEAPLVRTGTKEGADLNNAYGVKVGAVRADKPGRVMSVDEDGIDVKYADGTKDRIDLYNNYPLNRKTFWHQTPVVNPGDIFRPGQLLAKSNYTDDEGNVTLGTNLYTAYIPWKGLTFEDAVVVSESAAKDKLASSHMYQYSIDKDDRTRLGKKNYLSVFPSKYAKEKLEGIDDDGVVKPGTVLNYGDPVILAMRRHEYAHNKIHKKGQAGFGDQTITWDHHDPGRVVDVYKGEDGPVISVESISPAKEGDKLSGRHGDKGVIARIIPDELMPRDTSGRVFDILVNPGSLNSRVNSGQIIEMALGKVAEKTGKPYAVVDFDGKDMVEMAYNELADHGISDIEDIIDPENERKIKGVMIGPRFFMKLHHTSESKAQARSGGSYSSEDAPAKGSGQGGGSKRLAMMDSNALMSHGATEVLRDAHLVRGQSNQDYWMQFMKGYTPLDPKQPLAYDKFIAMMRGAGIHIVKDGPQLHFMAMTDDDIDYLAGKRTIKSGDTVDVNRGLEPVSGGLFDKAITGGHSGRNWAKIDLAEPMVNPVMEEPVRRVLGLTEEKFHDVLAGKHELNGSTGPEAILKALSNIDLDKEIRLAKLEVNTSSRSRRDNAVRRLKFLEGAKKQGIHPKDWVLTKVPVLPPIFRPISVLGEDKIPLVADANFLYKELIEANDNLRELKDRLGDQNVGDERLTLYKAFKAVTGLGDPITVKSQSKRLKGLLGTVFGAGPKWSYPQRKLLSNTVDNVGRGVVLPNPDMGVDQIGIPEEKAFDMYKRYLVRRMRRKGMPLVQAIRNIEEKTDLARSMLMEEMDNRPVIVNRAPVLHKFGILAFRPKLMRGSSIHVSPLVVGGYGMDFDGDAVQIHVPATKEAVEEAYDRLLPSKSLLSPADFKTPVHKPTREYALGLYHATTAKKRKQPHVFKSSAEAIAAWRAGRVSSEDPVVILG